MSKTYIATLASLIASFTFLQEAEALNIINGLVHVVTTLVTLYGRYDAGGVEFWGTRK